MKLVKSERFIHTGIILILSILCFYQVSLNLHPMKYDMIDCFYPWRYFVSSAISQGDFPYWNPFQDLGYPVHADPSSGAWYPVAWFFSLFGKYSIYTINLEYIFHIFFAGIGFYKLSKTLNFPAKIALFGAIAYMFSGVFVGNAQHLPYVVSVCWLPFVINYYFVFKNNGGFKPILYAGLFLSLMITGGYPAFTIILFYLLLIFFLAETVSYIRTKNWTSLKQFTIRNGIFAIVAISLCIGYFASLYTVSPYLSRLGDFSVEEALFSPFSPASFVSFVSPYATVVNDEVFNADLSMRNGYFGIIPFVFFLAGAFRKKPKELKILFYFGLFCLLAAVGSSLPVREFLYKYVPMMNVFRFPSVFRGFFILAAILIALHFLREIKFSEYFPRKKVLILFSGIFGLYVIIYFLSQAQGSLSIGTFLKEEIFTVSENSSIWQHLAATSILQVVLVLIFIVIVWLLKSVNYLKLLTVFLVADLFLSIQLVGPYTIYNEKVTAREVQTAIDQFPDEIPLQNDLTIEQTDVLPSPGFPIWRNQAIYQHRISSRGFNSFSLSGYEKLERDYPYYMSQLKQNRHLLLSDTVMNVALLADHEKAESSQKEYLYFETGDHSYLKSLDLYHSANDTAFFTDVKYTEFYIKTKTEKPQLLTLFQKNYIGWKAFVDQKQVPIYLASENFMTVELPAGEHEVEFRYNNPTIRYALYLNIFTLGTVILLLILFEIKGQDATKTENQSYDVGIR